MNPCIPCTLLVAVCLTAGAHAAEHALPTHETTMDSASSPTAQPYDLQFLDTMTHHHQGAIDMARLAQTQAGSATLKAFARDIISAQQQEIDQFRSWRQAWYPGLAPAINMRMPGMMQGMQPMQHDMPALQQARGAAFDRLFLQLMIPHHQGAITMSQPALQQAQHPELRTAARHIIDSQTQEISQMRQWLRQLPP